MFDFLKLSTFSLLFLFVPFLLPIKIFPVSYFNPDWSPDGKLITFEVLGRFRKNRDVYLVTYQGLSIQQLTNNLDARNPTWSSDSKQIAFLCKPIKSQKPRLSDVCVVNLEDLKVRKLTNNGSVSNFTWSPDGKFIAFSARQGNLRKIYVVRLSDSKVSQLTSGIKSKDWSPTWSPNHKKIAFDSVSKVRDESKSGSSEIFLMEAGKPSKLQSIAYGYYPSWSKDSNQIAFYDRRPSLSNPRFNVINMDDNLSTVVELSTIEKSEHFYSAPIWSNDGQKIAFSTVKRRAEKPAIGKIHLVKTENLSSPQYIAQGYDFSWSPDSKNIVFSNRGKLLIIDTESLQITQLKP